MMMIEQADNVSLDCVLSTKFGREICATRRAQIGGGAAWYHGRFR